MGHCAQLSVGAGAQFPMLPVGAGGQGNLDLERRTHHVLSLQVKTARGSDSGRVVLSIFSSQPHPESQGAAGVKELGTDYFSRVPKR